MKTYTKDSLIQSIKDIRAGDGLLVQGQGMMEL